MNEEVTNVSTLASLVQDAVMPNYERLVSIWNRGGVAVLFYKLDAARLPEVWSVDRLREIGWDLSANVQIERVVKSEITRLIDGAAWTRADGPAFARWLRRRTSHRLLAILEGATLCLNFDPEIGLTVEPGTHS